jgi:hypothetical protein
LRGGDPASAEEKWQKRRICGVFIESLRFAGEPLGEPLNHPGGFALIDRVL